MRAAPPRRYTFIIARTREVYCAAHAPPQHDASFPPPTAIGNPSFAPMKSTTASGRSLRSCATDRRPQSRRSLFEIPVPRCGSRTTRTPRRPDRSWASSLSSGMEERVAGHEQRPQRSRLRGTLAERGGIERVGRNGRHRRGVGPGVLANTLGVDPRSSSGDSPLVRSETACASGS